MVRCAGCGATWRAKAERALELTVTNEEGAFAAEPEAEVEDDDLFERPVSELAGEELPKAFRARAQAERRVREAATQGVIWAGMGAVFALLLVCAIVFRIDIVELWPRTASAYAAIGMPVNGSGLSIEDVHARPILQDGRPVLLVSGVVRSIRAKPVLARPIALLDKDQKHILVRSALPGGRLVLPGEVRRFAIRMVDPPRTDVWVTLDSSQGAAGSPSAHVAEQAAPPPANLRPTPSIVEDAAPLASSSPYALPSGSAGGSTPSP